MYPPHDPRLGAEFERLSDTNRTSPSPRLIASIVWDLLRHRPPADDSDLIHALVEARPEGLAWNGPARKNGALAQAIQVGAASTSDGQCMVLGLARWAQAGHPLVVLPATYAAALLSTAVQDALLPSVREPFPAFAINVPEGLLPVDNPEGPDFIWRVLAYRHQHSRHPDGAWAYVAWTRRTLTLWRFGVGVADLLPPELETTGLADALASFPVEITDLDRRTKALLGRLIINTCLAMTDPANVRTQGAVHHVGRPLHLDLREKVLDYGLGRAGRSPEVGGWVSSHWKMQPYGPGKALRKWIFVEPYWRGPDEAGADLGS